MDTYHQWTAIALGVIVGGVYAWTALATSLLKDTSTASVAPYSLSRTQLLWWTAVITLCVIAHYGLTGDFVALNQTALVLLGISLGTSGLAKVIDNSDENAEAAAAAQAAAAAAAAAAANQGAVAVPALVTGAAPVKRHQDEDSVSFIRDILSDETGPSTHRLQIFAFNLIYGVLFVGKFLSDPLQGLPQFGDMELAILGISASGYLYLKNTENE